MTVQARAQNVSYSYDQLGRLVGVVDTYGNSATYNYDGVGNLKSITNGTASTVAVSGFIPATGSATTHTPVTIQGSNFSATASQNVVKFNGVSAVVGPTSTTTMLFTSVPTSATTGPISVAVSPLGTGVSSSAFTVTP